MWRYGVNTAKSLIAYHRKKLKVPNYPFIQGVEVTSACNLRCSFCKRGHVEKRGIGYMTWKTFRCIVNRENRLMLRHTRLFMHGEPLLHKLLPEFVEYAKKYAKTVGITTNGTLLTPDLSKRLLDAGLTSICFSGHKPEISFNIHEFLEIKRQVNPECHVTVAVVDPYETGYITLLNMRGVDEVKVLPEHDWGLAGERKHVCLWPWWGLTVYWNGDVAPCCLYEEPCRLGNVNRQSVTEIWNSQEYQEVRRRMLTGELCETCAISDVTLNEAYLHVDKPSTWRLPAALLKLGAAVLK